MSPLTNPCYATKMSVIRKTKQFFTYNDYLTWPDNERWEIINGEAYNMSPAPTIAHQEVTGGFFTSLSNQLKGKECTPFIAPTDVVLSEDNVVQPDVFVVCQKNKILKTHIAGAPDLVIEVLSPATALKDRREKKELYEKFGVKEYILVDPEEKYVERFSLSKGHYKSSDIFGPTESFSLKVIKGIKIELKEIF